MGSAPVAGTRTNGQRTVSGIRITIAIRKANRNAASSIQPNERMIHGGGSWGSISDSTSIEPRWVKGKFIKTGLDSELLTREIIIEAALGHQFVVGSNLGHASFLQDHNGMRFPDRA